MTEDMEADAAVETPLASGWEDAQVQTKPCHELGRRHSYKGGDVCLKCGFPKPVHQPRTPRVIDGTERTPTRRSGGEAVKLFRGGLSMGWFGLGIGIENLPIEQTRHVSIPVGRTLQFQAPIAGKRITSALQKTPAWKPILAMLRAVGPWADLAPLIAPPIFVALMAQFPKLQQRLMPMAVGMLLPIIAETTEMAEEQAEMMANMSKYNQEAINEAMSVLGGIFEGTDDGEQHPNGVVNFPGQS